MTQLRPHRHVTQPTLTTLEWGVPPEERRQGNVLRCSWEVGDPCRIKQVCRCGAHRITQAIYKGFGEAEATGKVGDWVFQPDPRPRAIQVVEFFNLTQGHKQVR